MTKQVINIGTTDNDGTGSTVRASYDICNDNFTELYAFLGIGSAGNTSLGCCQGTKYEAFRRGFKMFGVNRNYQTAFYYVSNFICGTGSGTLTYTIEISRANTISAAGTVVMSHTIAHTEYSGVVQFGLGQANNSGLLGNIEIDFSQFVTGTTYTAVSWVEAGLYAVNLYTEVSTGGGGTPASLIEFTDDFSPDGSLPIYIYSGGSGKKATVVAIANIVGNVLIKNISAEALLVEAVDSPLIDGIVSISLAAGGWMNIIANNTKFEAVGVGYAAAP